MKKRTDIFLLASGLVLFSAMIYHFAFMDHSHDMTPAERACAQMKEWHPDCKIEM